MVGIVWDYCSYFDAGFAADFIRTPMRNGKIIMNISGQLEHKFCTFETQILGGDGSQIEGYASFFDICDQGGDIVQPGAYTASLETLGKQGCKVKMLWQHDPSQPIGVWDHVTED